LSKQSILLFLSFISDFTRFLLTLSFIAGFIRFSLIVFASFFEKAILLAFLKKLFC
jgi:hypothetical protein